MTDPHTEKKDYLENLVKPTQHLPKPEGWTDKRWADHLRSRVEDVVYGRTFTAAERARMDGTWSMQPMFIDFNMNHSIGETPGESTVRCDVAKYCRGPRATVRHYCESDDYKQCPNYDCAQNNSNSSM